VLGDHETEREGTDARDQRENGEAVLDRVAPAVGVQSNPRQMWAGACPDGFPHDRYPFVGPLAASSYSGCARL
jgi:hypothetical protein